MCLEDCVFLVADRSLGCQFQDGEGSWEQTQSERRYTSKESGSHLRRPPGSGPGGERLRGAEGGPPKPACSEDAPQATVWSCVRECCSLFLPPLQLGQQGATAQGHKLIFLLPLTLLSFCSLSFLVAARGVCVCVCACACALHSQCLSLVS